MIDYLDIDAKLDAYSDAFDFYMDCGEMPPTIPKDDALGEYMKEVIDNNPQIDGTDPIWREVLKEDLISFFSSLLRVFKTIQQEMMQELFLIAQFNAASIDQKRAMWKQVYHVISKGYSQSEINLSGYIEQFKTENTEAVLTSITQDWEKACKMKLDRRQRKALEDSKSRFEIKCSDAGNSNYETIKKTEQYIYNHPQLADIVNVIGRGKDISAEERDSIIYKFLPVTVSKTPAIEEIDRVETGNNIERTLPVELSMPEDLFFKKYALKELQLLSGPGKDKPRKIEKHKKTPRLTKGPIVVSIDTSGSMSGHPEEIAFSLLRQLLRMAKRQKRPCFLISFSVHSKSIDLSKPRNWKKFDDFLSHRFSGGTDGEEMLAESIHVLQSGTFEMADVLIISDLKFPAPKPFTTEMILREKALGTRFYALQIGNHKHEYTDIMDKIWKV